MKSTRDQSHKDLIEALDYSKIIVPCQIGVKYRPPKLGIEFYLKNDDSFTKALTGARRGQTPCLINDIDTFQQQILVYEIRLDEPFFTKSAQIHGERSYDDNRVNAHQSPMKPRESLSAPLIARKLFQDTKHRNFLNPNLLKFD